MHDSKTPSSGRRRGFFFTVMALAILSFMLLTVQLWVRVFEQSDIRAAERFKGEAMRQVLATLSDKALSDFANASSFYATYKLANYTSSNGGLARSTALDAQNPETGRVEENIRLLMLNGTSQSDMLPPIGYSESEKASYTLESWQGKIQQAANLMGFNTSFSPPQNFKVKQIDPWAVGIYFETEMNISDLEGTMRQSKRLKANSSFSINGFVDPSIIRGYLSYHPLSTLAGVPQKQIFRHAAYDEASDLAPIKYDGTSRSGGNGWFFGPITEDYPEDMNESEIGRLSQFVLVHPYDVKMPTYANYYGAVIVTSTPRSVGDVYSEGSCTYNRTQQADCINCLVEYSSTMPGCSKRHEFTNTIDRPMLLGGNGISSIPTVSRADEDGYKYVLIDNEHGSLEDVELTDYHRVWDVTKIRDMAICGFYVHEPTAPSFFQRMLAAPFSTPGINSSAYGIESFVVGKWAGGADDYLGANAPHALYSRLDSEFFTGVSGNTFRVKGMMGCKSKEMCAWTAGGNNATKEGVGVFRLAQDAVSRYGLSEIACGFPGQQSAQCE